MLFFFNSFMRHVEYRPQNVPGFVESQHVLGVRIQVEVAIVLLAREERIQNDHRNAIDYLVVIGGIRRLYDCRTHLDLVELNRTLHGSLPGSPALLLALLLKLHMFKDHLFVYLMPNDDTTESKPPLVTYCSDSGGELQIGQINWSSEPLQQVCVSDIASRERNPYKNFWGIAFASSSRSIDGNVTRNSSRMDTEPYVSIRIAGGSLKDIISLPEITPPNEMQRLDRFYRISNVKLVPANLTWCDNPPHVVGIRNLSKKSVRSYEKVWEIVFPGSFEQEFGVLPNEFSTDLLVKPHLVLQACDEFRQRVDP